jgi:hypothetical protein
VFGRLKTGEKPRKCRGCGEPARRYIECTDGRVWLCDHHQGVGVTVLALGLVKGDSWPSIG